MAPVMMATLAVVVAYQIESVGAQLSSLVSVIPIFVAVQTIKVFVGQGVGEVARLDPAATRALMFSGATRNSLVVLPLALALPLALPPALSLAAVVVVAQTLVELVGMVIYVYVIPRLVPMGEHAARESIHRLACL